MSAIFISHRSTDNAVAAEIHEWLESKGHRSVFLDFDPADGIPAGRNWEQEIYQQLKSSRAVIILCSGESMASKWVFAEITHARALGKYIVPLKIEDCTIDRLISDRQVVDMTTLGHSDRQLSAFRAELYSRSGGWRTPVSGQALYLPVQLGVRRSRKAATPSFASSVNDTAVSPM